jgi:hypothetical protein
MLNGMIAEAEHKLDLEEVRCSEFEKKQLALMEQTKQDIAMYNAIAAEARADILAAQTQIELLTQKIPELNDSLDQLVKKCAAETASLRAQLAVLEADIQVINRVVAMTDCAPGSSSSSALVQLHLRSCKPVNTDTSFIEFTHHALNKAVVGLKSEVAKVGLQRHLEQAFQETKQLTALVQRAAQDHVQQPPVTTSAAPPDDEAKKKCTVARSPVCHKMLDRFLNIQRNRRQARCAEGRTQGARDEVRERQGKLGGADFCLRNPPQGAAEQARNGHETAERRRGAITPQEPPAEGNHGRV